MLTVVKSTGNVTVPTERKVVMFKVVVETTEFIQDLQRLVFTFVMLLMPLLIPLVTIVGPWGLLLGTLVLIPLIRLVLILVVPAKTLLLICVKSVTEEVFTLKASTVSATLLGAKVLFLKINPKRKN